MTDFSVVILMICQKTIRNNLKAIGANKYFKVNSSNFYLYALYVYATFVYVPVLYSSFPFFQKTRIGKNKYSIPKVSQLFLKNARRASYQKHFKQRRTKKINKASSTSNCYINLIYFEFLFLLFLCLCYLLHLLHTFFIYFHNTKINLCL